MKIQYIITLKGRFVEGTNTASKTRTLKSFVDKTPTVAAWWHARRIGYDIVKVQVIKSNNHHR